MVSVKDMLQKLQRINVDSMTETIIKENENEIVELNIDNLEKGLDFNDKLVGRYTRFTQEIAEISSPKPLLPKIAGDLYNFVWSGDLVFNIFVSSRGNKIDFDSRGKGTGDKLEFVTDNDLLGLSDNKARILNVEILRPKYVEKVKNGLNL